MLCSAVTLEPIPISSTNFSKYVVTSWCVYVRAKYNPWCPTACFTQEWVKKVQHSIFCWLVTLSSASHPCCTSGCSIAGGWWKCHLGMRWPRYLIVLLLGDGVCHLFVASVFRVCLAGLRKSFSLVLLCWKTWEYSLWAFRVGIVGLAA